MTDDKSNTLTDAELAARIATLERGLAEERARIDEIKSQISRNEATLRDREARLRDIDQFREMLRARCTPRDIHIFDKGRCKS